jgi:hypothetical protein
MCWPNMVCIKSTEYSTYLQNKQLIAVSFDVLARVMSLSHIVRWLLWAGRPVFDSWQDTSSSSRLNVQTESEAFPAPCPMGNGRPFLRGIKRPGRETDHSPPCNTDVKKERRYTSTNPYAYMAWCLECSK